MKTVDDVAKDMSVHPETVRRWCRAGKLGARQMMRGGTWRIPDNHQGFHEELADARRSEIAPA